MKRGTVEQLGDDVVAVRIGERHGERVMEYDVKCCLCKNVFTRNRYDLRFGYVCDPCKEMRKKELQEKQKEKQKLLEEKAFRKAFRVLPKVKKDMCDQFCIIPKAFSDETARNEACSKCPLLRLEGGVK